MKPRSDRAAKAFVKSEWSVEADFGNVIATTEKELRALETYLRSRLDELLR